MQAVEVLETIPTDSQWKWELQIINALSTLAVIEHEVVAVVKNLDPSMLDPDLDLDMLTLITVVKPLDQPIKPPRQPFWKVALTQNFHSDDPNPSHQEGQPIITSAEALAGLELANNEVIKKYADKCW